MTSLPVVNVQRNSKFSRRQFVIASLSVAATSLLITACGGSAATPTAAPAAPAAAPAATATTGSAAAPAATATGASATSATGATATTAPAAGATPVAASTRPVTPTFYSWITNLHPSIPAINSDFAKKTPLNMQIAPTQGFGIDRFVAEAKDKSSTWDVYVGMTPFVEMVSLVKADVIVPWDDFIPKDVLDDLLPSIRAECTYNGKLYSWPFFLDIITMGWNSEITDKAGIKDNPPKDWDTYLKYGKQVVDSKSSTYGVTFDAHGWRSLAPFTHSMSTDAYYDDGSGGLLFDFTNPAAIQSLDLMKKMLPLSGPNVLNPGTSDGGVNDTPDESSFAAQEVAYYCKYQNAPLRFAATWPDPKKLGMAPIPKFSGGAGSTVFWTTGCCLFKYGQNKQGVVDYIKALTYDDRIWHDSIAGTATAHPGQLPPYKSIYDKWNKTKPDWMQDFVGLVRTQLDVAKAIPNHRYGLSQFNIGQPEWEKYLKGEQTDIKKAAQAAKDAVAAANKKDP